MIAIEAARPADRAAIEALLQANDLPTEGLELAMPAADRRPRGRPRRRLRDGGDLRPGGPASVRVRRTRSARDGLGPPAGRARPKKSPGTSGVDELFLLTETAAEWFARLGYTPDGREAAPASLQASPEFTGACPVSAALLRKRLDRTAPLD